MKGYVQEPETSDFKTEGWGEGVKDSARPPGVSRVQFIAPNLVKIINFYER